MSVGARHGAARARASEHARACPTERRARSRARLGRKGERKRRAGARARSPSRASTCGRRKRQLQLGRTATRPPPTRLGSSLRIPFYRFASTTLVSVPWAPPPPVFPLVYTRGPFSPSTSLSFFRSLPLSLTHSVARTEIFVVLRPPSALSPSLLDGAHCRCPPSCTVTRTYAYTHAHALIPKRRVVRQRGPPDSSPAAWQTPNGPTATVDTLPNFSGAVQREKEIERERERGGERSQEEAVKFGN